MMAGRLSEHLSFAELACVNRLGRQWEGFAPGELVAEYPKEWRGGRAVALAATFEAVRSLLGNLPVTINSGYRTPAYNATVGGVGRSQHTEGRALDIRHSKLKPRAVFAAIRLMEQNGHLPLLGGIGLYATFVHLDVRPRVGGHLAVWFGAGVQ
jgi:hypothetical protein